MATSTETLRSVLVTRDPEILSGEAVFAGTRVPVATLVDWLQGGDTIEDFLENFPSVRREQAEAALELLREFLLAK
jgi:uncharacterized protein (DUF433 family)